MTDPDPQRSPAPPSPCNAAAAPGPGPLPPGQTLEHIIDLTGELEHLNELIQLHLEREGGFSCTASYFSIVQPVLDMLEYEIRLHYQKGLGRDELKAIIGEWIDQEICLLQ